MSSTLIQFQPYPISEVLNQVKDALNTNNLVLLEASPGAGKSTILPLNLSDCNWLNGKKILMLEPRRVAVKSIASRMAELKNESVGQSIGYNIRFEKKTSKSSKIEIITEGILNRLISKDYALEEYGLIIFDEFHERNINSDLGFSLCMQVQQIVRPDLRILLMSATLDSEKYLPILDNPPIIKSSGRQYPIQNIYLGDYEPNQLFERIKQAIKQAYHEQEGDILVFLPGVFEIKKTLETLQNTSINAEILPLYGELSLEEQLIAMRSNKTGKRKIVLSTSIAETSLTIEGVSTVIDSGLARVPVFDLKTGLTKLTTSGITKDVATQRAGRAGRTREGICYKLWSKTTDLQLFDCKIPEILNGDLSPLMLELYAWGISDIDELKWIDKPPISNVNQAKDLLCSLGAIDNNKITEKGKKLLKYSTHPRIANLLINGEQIGFGLLAADIASILEEKDPIKSNLSDISERLKALTQYRAGDKTTLSDTNVLSRIDKLSAQFCKAINTAIAPSPQYKPHNAIGYLLASAYPDRIAKRKDKNKALYQLGNGKIAKLNPDDYLQNEEWLAIAQMGGMSIESNISLAAALDPLLLSEQHRYSEVLEWDYLKKELISKKETKLAGITLKATMVEPKYSIEYQTIIDTVIDKEKMLLFELSDELQNWINRNNSLFEWNGEKEWQKLDEHNILNLVKAYIREHSLIIRKQDDLKKLDLSSIIKNFYPYEKLREIELLSPESLKVPSGFEVKITYHKLGDAPVLAVRLQEMFGLLETPRINNGKTPLILHLLSPGFKPVQITQDLKSFWQNTYPEVKKELQRRYPKHSWPDDPWTAQAVRGVRKEYKK